MPDSSRSFRSGWLVLVAFMAACAGDKGYEMWSAEQLATTLERAPDPQERIRAANMFYRSPQRSYLIVHRLLE